MDINKLGNLLHPDDLTRENFHRLWSQVDDETAVPLYGLLRSESLVSPTSPVSGLIQLSCQSFDATSPVARQETTLIFYPFMIPSD